MYAPTTDDEPLAFIVVKLGRLLERRLNRANGGGELTASQLLVLSLIARQPGSSRADVARRVHTSPQAVGGVLTQLMNAGLITRVERDVGRSHDFSVTEEGCSVLEEAEVDGQLASHRALEAFRSDHRRFIDGALRHLLHSLEFDDAASSKAETVVGQHPMRARRVVPGSTSQPMNT